MAIRLPREPEIDFSTFPETDGKPMADNEVNQEQMIELILEFRQAVAPLGHHVGGTLLVYYDPANGWNHCAPDVFVALDAGPALRESWKVWVEGKFPEVVFEVASPSTQNRDIREKVRLYEAQGAQEYYIYDPARRLRPAYRGYARQGGQLVPLAIQRGRSIVSPLLGLELRVVGGWLRVINPATSKPYLSPREQQAQLRAAERRAWREAQARKNAERARQAAEVGRQAAEAAQRAAEDQAQREATARQIAEAARRAAEDQVLRETTARQQADAARQAIETRLQATDAALRAALAELARLRGDKPREE
jgi:Uma2 family endonuclease